MNETTIATNIRVPHFTHDTEEDCGKSRLKKGRNQHILPNTEILPCAPLLHFPTDDRVDINVILDKPITIYLIFT